jgi:hypothetical protein
VCEHGWKKLVRSKATTLLFCEKSVHT